MRKHTSEQATAYGKKGGAASRAGTRRKYRREMMGEIQNAYAINPQLTVTELLLAFAQEIISEVD